jgi:NAD(P)-dependent dehydrogenase (short-subunit alcohol dehydrogenase family)
MDAFGRIDVLVANAGILRDKSFGKMEIKDFEAVVNVHLMGTVKPARAVWEIMKSQGYGRIVVTTSSTGLYGNFGQTNYGAAKASLVGFMNSLKLEGAKDNIKVNAVCPVAATRMTESLMPPALLEMLKPEFVSPAVAWLASEDAPTGVIMTAAAGVFAAAQMVETDGINLGHGATADDIASHFAEIADWSSAKHYAQGGEQSAKFFARLQEKPLLG